MGQPPKLYWRMKLEEEFLDYSLKRREVGRGHGWGTKTIPPPKGISSYIRPELVTAASAKKGTNRKHRRAFLEGLVGSQVVDWNLIKDMERYPHERWEMTANNDGEVNFAFDWTTAGGGEARASTFSPSIMTLQRARVYMGLGKREQKKLLTRYMYSRPQEAAKWLAGKWEIWSAEGFEEVPFEAHINRRVFQELLTKEDREIRKLAVEAAGRAHKR